MMALVFIFIFLLAACSPVTESDSDSSTQSTAAQGSNVVDTTDMPVCLQNESKIEHWLVKKELFPELSETYSSKTSESPVTFELRTPKSYSIVNSSNYYSYNFHFWNKDRKDSLRPILMLSVVGKQKNQKRQDPIWKCLKAAIYSIHKSKSENWKQSPVEAGKIDGITFVRQYWSGTEKSPQGKLKVSGFVYVGSIGETLIIGLSTDKDTKAVELAEASLQSFQLVR